MLTEIAISAAGNAIGNEVAGSIIDKAAAAVDQITENTGIRFSNVGQDLIAQITNSIEELRKQIGRDINKIVEELSDTLKVQLYNLTLTIDKLLKTTIDAANEFTDDVIRDIRSLISKTWFMSEIYALDNIEGTLIPASHQGDWVIKVSGLNVGFDSEEIESVIRIRIKLPNAPVFEAVGAEVSQHSVEFVIPREIIEDNRKENSITIIDAELKINMKKDGTLWFNKKFKGIQPFKLTLAPSVAGQLFVRYAIPEYTWVKDPKFNIVYSNALPSGHGSSSSKVIHHKITRYFELPRASVPPILGDRRFYAAERGACTGGGCSHLHTCQIKVINNGATLDVYTYNNSHAITVRIKGKVERFDMVGENFHDSPPIKVASKSTIKVIVPKSAGTIILSGHDLDFGMMDLVIKCNPSQQIYPMPSGKHGGLEYLGNHLEGENLIYRFFRN